MVYCNVNSGGSPSPGLKAHLVHITHLFLDDQAELSTTKGGEICLTARGECHAIVDHGLGIHPLRVVWVRAQAAAEEEEQCIAPALRARSMRRRAARRRQGWPTLR
eukprot:COSAG06_NODE_4407_length_4293_cov_1.841440_3_plen_106_part_00